MALAPSSGATRLLGLLSFSTIIFLLKKISERTYHLPWDNTWTKETCWHGLFFMATGPEAITIRDWCVSFWPNHTGKLFSFLIILSLLIDHKLYIQSIFELYAYLIVVFGDIPAISMIRCMKGHNSISPCCMCNIQGIHMPSSRLTTHYVPLNHDHFPGQNAGYQADSLSSKSPHPSSISSWSSSCFNHHSLRSTCH